MNPTIPGIAADVTAERGYLTVTAADIAHPRYGFDSYQKADGILIPLCPPDGTNGRYQLRRRRNRVAFDRETGKQREIKYEQPTGQAHRLDVHPRNQKHLQDVTVPGYVTEGVKKGDALTSAGRFAIALGGVWCFRKECLPDWDRISLNGRTMIIVFDSDAESNQNVAMARDELGRFLSQRGAKVRIIRLPASADGSKQGIDDYLAAGGDLVDLLAEHCEDWRPRGSIDCERPLCQSNANTLGLLHAILTDETKPMPARATFVSVFLENRGNPDRPHDNQKILARKCGLRSTDTLRKYIEPFATFDGPIKKVESTEEITEEEYIRRTGRAPNRPFPQGVMSVPRVRYDLRYSDEGETLQSYLRIPFGAGTKRAEPKPKPDPKTCPHLAKSTTVAEVDRCIACQTVVDVRPIPTNETLGSRGVTTPPPESPDLFSQAPPIEHPKNSLVGDAPKTPPPPADPPQKLLTADKKHVVDAERAIRGYFAINPQPTTDRPLLGAARAKNVPETVTNAMLEYLVAQGQVVRIGVGRAALYVLPETLKRQDAEMPF